MQFPENIPKIPAIIGIVLLVAVTAVGAITLGGFTDNAPSQQGISDEEAQKIIDSENATQPALENVTVSDEPATAEEIDAFNKYAENEKASVKAARTPYTIYNPISQPPASQPTQPAPLEVIGGELVSDEDTDPNDIPDDSAFEEPQENYDDDIPEYEDEPNPDDIPVDEDDEGYYSDEPYDPFDDDIFEDGDDGDEDPEEWEGDE